MSICAMIVMGVLFLSETWAFARSGISTSITVDETSNPQIRLNFNLTFLDLHCDYVSVDVWDALGTNRQNVTKNVDKWQLDELGTKRVFSGRNREAREVAHEEHDKTLDQMHAEEGVNAVELKGDNFEEFMEQHTMAFVDYFAPWYVYDLMCVKKT
jgi:Endoplasmic Reticulum-Golgi Intermediate Compartment (ERGIC)